MRARRLIVNADGFGFGAGATQGILDAIRRGGFISSVSVNANFPEARRVRELVEEFPRVSVGVHLNAMAGKPCLPAAAVPSLVTPEGNFHDADFVRRLRAGLIDRDELCAELNAQIETVRASAGQRLTHIDSQENTHLYFFDLFLALARRWNLARMRNNASLICLEARRPRRAPRVCAWPIGWSRWVTRARATKPCSTTGCAFCAICPRAPMRFTAIRRIPTTPCGAGRCTAISAPSSSRS